MRNGSPNRRNPNHMNIALWIAQASLSVAFLAASGMKIGMSEMTLSKKLPWTNDFTMKQIRTIGLLEFLGAIGVIAPWATGVLSILTPVAAAGLCCVMVGAAFTHIRRKEYDMIAVNVLLFALAAFVAAGRLSGAA